MGSKKKVNRYYKQFSFENLFINHFWLITITALLNVFVGIGWLTTLLLPIVIYAMMFKGKRTISFNIIDVLWFLSLFWMICTWFLNDYSHKSTLIIRCLASQIAYMMVYWIARKSSINYMHAIIKKAYVPLLITSVIGIYCFFFTPSWYQALINKAINSKDIYMTESLIAEISRLRSIFDSPYTLAYFIAITLMYEWFCIVKKERVITMKYLAFIGVLVSTMVLTMMRAPIAFALFAFILAIVYGLIYNAAFSVTKKMIVIFSIGMIGMFVVINNLDRTRASHILRKYESVTNDGEEFLDSRLFLMKVKMSIDGDGAGRHALYADKYPPNYSLRDGEYMKTIAEQGYIGLFLLLLLFGIGLIKSLWNFEYLYFEFCLISMLFASMIGANPLSTSDKFPIIFWLALGQISSFKSKRKNGLNYYSNVQRS